MRNRCTGCLVIVGLAAGVGLALACRNSREAGKGLLESVQEIPAHARRYAEDLRGRAQQAVVSGRQAAFEKEAEIETVLAGDMSTPAADGAHSDA